GFSPGEEPSWLRSWGFLVRRVAGAFVDFAHGIKHQIGCRAQHRALRRGGAVNKFVDAFVSVDAALQNKDDGFVAKQSAAFGMRNFSAFIEENRIGLSVV